MKLKRTHRILALAIAGIALVAAGARTRAVQAWYDTVKVQGTVTGYLLDERAGVEGLLLDNGQQVRVGPRLGAAVASRIKKGDTIAAVGRGGRTSAFGRLVDAEAVTVNGQTLTLAGEPEGPHGPPGRGGRGRADGPGGPGGPGDPGGPRGPRGPHAGPPPPAGRGGADAPPPPAPPVDAATPGVDAPPPPPPANRADGPGASVPTPSAVTIHGTVAAYIVGHGGEVVGLALTTGEQVRFPPRLGERLTQTAGLHPDVTVTGDAVRSDYGIIVRPAQLTVGAQTLLLR